MRYFTLLDFQDWLVALCLGLLVVILIYVAWRLYPEPEEEEGAESTGGQMPAGHAPSLNPFPPILIFVSIGALLWALGYVIIEGILGGAFG